MVSLIYFGQYVRHHRLKNGMSQKELSKKIFNKENESYIGKLELGRLDGITFATAGKILTALNSEMRFEQLPTYVPELHRRY